MKTTALLTGVALLGLVSVSQVSIQGFTPTIAGASAQTLQVQVTESVTAQGKIDQLTAIKGKPGSAELMRKLYVQDLTPIGIQKGGSGMVVNLYSKRDNTTISLCTDYDVIVAVKQGKIAKFAPAEVK